MSHEPNIMKCMDNVFTLVPYEVRTQNLFEYLDVHDDCMFKLRSS